MDALRLSLLLLVAFVPPIILAVRLRNAERHRREPWQGLARAFAWGALGAATLSIAAETALDRHLAGAALFWPVFPVTLVLVAPFVEEVTKALGLRFIHEKHPEPEDGYIYGGVVGLGFAATENTIYILSAFLVSGEQTAIATAMYRGIATVALHGAASAIAGYGLWRGRYERRLRSAFLGVFAAIALHVAYNALTRLTDRWATALAVTIAVVAYMRIMRRVRILDERGAAPRV